jgi:flagellar biosynthesis protein FliP
MSFDREEYFTVQVIYRGWAFLGIVLIAAMLLNFVVTLMVWRQRPAMLSASGATVLLGLSLTIFFIWTSPVNQATNNWSSAPENWQILRAQWEYSHAVNGGVTFLALCASTLSGLIWRR